jgi:hypothetical protein
VIQTRPAFGLGIRVGKEIGKKKMELTHHSCFRVY